MAATAFRSSAAARHLLHLAPVASSALFVTSHSAAAAAPLLRLIATVSGGNNPISWNLRRFSSSNEKHLPALPALFIMYLLQFREDVKEEFTKFGAVRYVDFREGEDSGYIRFEESTASEKARAFAALQDEGGFIMKGHLVTLEHVTGQAEKEYWSAIHSKSNKGRDWQSNKGGKQFGGKRGRR